MHESGCTGSVSVRQMRTESLPFSSVPLQSKLFLQYLDDPGELKHFYPEAVGSYREITGKVENVLEHYTTDRARLCDALSSINKDYGAGDATMANIELLRGSRTVAVLTGQQTGLFTGPLYSIYKAISAIKLAEYLRSVGVDAVPVFWMATEDHDLDEVSNAFAIGNTNELVESRFIPQQSDVEMPVGRVKLNGSADRAIQEFFNALPQTECTADVLEQVKDSWKQGSGFGKAFGTFLTSLLGKYGLIIVDPLDEEIKQLSSPIYSQASEKSGEIVKALVERGKELEEAGYHAQVLVEDDYFPLFWHDETGRRIALRRTSDGTLRVKGGRQTFTDQEIAALARTEPSRLSPGVMLRPVVQDHLFPTVCYFGGGAEIAYFAQNSEVYRILDRPVTPIMHRQSFTVIEAKHARTLEKYNLCFSDLFAGKEEILPRVIDEFIDPASAKMFAEVEESINTELNRLDQSLSRLDVTLAENLATRRRKVLYHIAALRKKYYFRRSETDETINRRVKAAFDALLPNGQLQERVLNVVSFLDRYGPAFIDAVYDSIDLDDKGHRIIYL